MKTKKKVMKRYQTDGGGLALSCDDCKVQAGASTWKTRIVGHFGCRTPLRIAVLAVTDFDYLEETFAGRREDDVHFLLPADRAEDGRRIKERFRRFGVALRGGSQLSVYLCGDPATVVFGVAHFGRRHGDAVALAVHSQEALDWCILNVWDPAWAAAEVL